MEEKSDTCIAKKVMDRQIADGGENQEYADEPSHFGLYDVNTIANYDREIIPLLDSPVGSAFERTSTGFQAAPEGFQAFQRR